MVNLLFIRKYTLLIVVLAILFTNVFSDSVTNQNNFNNACYQNEYNSTITKYLSNYTNDLTYLFNYSIFSTNRNSSVNKNILKKEIHYRFNQI